MGKKALRCRGLTDGRTERDTLRMLPFSAVPTLFSLEWIWWLHYCSCAIHTSKNTFCRSPLTENDITCAQVATNHGACEVEKPSRDWSMPEPCARDVVFSRQRVALIVHVKEGGDQIHDRQNIDLVLLKMAKLVKYPFKGLFSDCRLSVIYILYLLFNADMFRVCKGTVLFWSGNRSIIVFCLMRSNYRNGKYNWRFSF